MIRPTVTGVRARIAFFHDILMAGVSFPLSMYLRLGPEHPMFEWSPLLLGTLLFVVISGAVFLSMRLYGGVWRYASVNDLMAITRAVTLVILVFLPAMFLLDRLESVPRSLMIINWLVLMVLLGGPRFVYRQFKDKRDFTANEDGSAPVQVPVLLIGAGDEAEMFIRALGHRRNSPYKAVGIADERGRRIGRNIHGVEVLGDLDAVPTIMADLARKGRRPQRLILTKANTDGATVRRLFDLAEAEGATLARIPRLTDLRSGTADEVEVRPIAIEDLLGRPQAVLDRDSMKALVHGKRVLITGAGGTIGGELVRQVAAFEPAQLCLLDSSEFHLYEIDLQVQEQHPALDRQAELADVRDRRRVDAVFAGFAPELVFHAAALKHVPMVENHPDEGVLTNVVGTRNVAEACRRHEVDTMVLISTDKAVNPSSVMGATKRLAESYCQALDLVEGRQGGTRYITVRFGNVLGSTGSVVPLFQRQLARGGPLTVTHQDMTRYFMTVREAVELVLQASALGSRGDREEGKIYVLDMGEPVRILDLAKQVILLAGLQPDKDIEIEITGIRPGEKLSEEVLHRSEQLVPTEHGSILLASPRAADHALLARTIDELETVSRDRHTQETLAAVRRAVPEYRPSEEPPPRAAASV